MDRHVTGNVPDARTFLRGVRYISLTFLFAIFSAHGSDEQDRDSNGFHDHRHRSNFTVFAATDGANGAELWRTNGRERGTRMVKDIFPGPSDSNPKYFTKFRGEYYFSANDGVIMNGLWKTDGTEAGTVLVTTRITVGAGNVIPPSFKVFNGALYFTTADGHPDSAFGISIWKTDGTDTGTVRVKGLDPNNRITDSFSSFSPYFTFNNTLYISARDNSGGWELWKSDGTEAGTVLVKDINPGSASSHPSDFAVLKGELYFTAVDDVTRRQIWKTDGTDAGTLRITEINPSTFIPVNGLTAFRRALYFQGDDGAHGVELWKSDGTAAGTAMVEDINPGSSSSNPASFTIFHGRLYFSAAVADGGFITPIFIWTTDGTEARTVQVSQARIGRPGFTVLNNAFYFVGENSSEIWRSNGTEAGTRRVKLISPVPPCTPSDCSGVAPRNFRVFNDLLLFEAADAVYGRELWRSNGTEAGTHVLKDICPGACSSHVIPRS